MLVADWSKGSIKMAGGECQRMRFFHHAVQGSREATREGEAMEAEKQGESEGAEKKMARKTREKK